MHELDLLASRPERNAAGDWSPKPSEWAPWRRSSAPIAEPGWRRPLVIVEPPKRRCPAERRDPSKASARPSRQARRSRLFANRRPRKGDAFSIRVITWASPVAKGGPTGEKEIQCCRETINVALRVGRWRSQTFRRLKDQGVGRHVGECRPTRREPQSFESNDSARRRAKQPSVPFRWWRVSERPAPSAIGLEKCRRE